MKTIKLLLIYLFLSNAFPGLWALFFPGSFYTSFPGMGFHWIDIMGPYSEHLTRDVGAFFCAIAFLSLFSFFKLEENTLRLTAYATAVFAVPHLVYHICMIGMFPTLPDKVAGILAIGLNLIVPLLILTLAKKNKLFRPQTIRF